MRHQLYTQFLILFLSIIFFSCASGTFSQCDSLASITSYAVKLICESKSVPTLLSGTTINNYAIPIGTDTAYFSVDYSDKKIKVTWQTKSGLSGSLVALL